MAKILWISNAWRLWECRKSMLRRHHLSRQIKDVVCSPSLPPCLLHLPYKVLTIKKVGQATNGSLVFGDVLQDIHDDRRWDIHLNQLPNSLHRNINYKVVLRIYFILMRVRIHPIKKWIRIRLLNISNEQMKNYRTVVFFFCLFVCWNLVNHSEIWEFLLIYYYLNFCSWIRIRGSAYFCRSNSRKLKCCGSNGSEFLAMI